MARAFALGLLGAGACVTASARDARAENAAARACIEAATDGQKLRDSGRLLEAHARLLACTQDACPADVRSDCASWLAKVDESTPRVVLGARDAAGRDLVDVRVLANDAVIATELLGREQALDPGPYRFVFEAADGSRATVSVVLRVGDGIRPVIATFAPRAAPDEPPPAAPASSSSQEAPWSKRTIALVGLGGGALVGAGVFTASFLHARAEYDDLRSACAPSCTDDHTRTLRTDIAIANVAGVATLALAAAFVGVAVFTRATPAAASARRGQPPLFDLPRIVWK